MDAEEHISVETSSRIKNGWLGQACLVLLPRSWGLPKGRTREAPTERRLREVKIRQRAWSTKLQPCIANTIYARLEDSA